MSRNQCILPFDQVRNAWEDYVIDVGEEPTAREIAAIIGRNKDTVGLTLVELRKSGQCGGEDEVNAQARRTASARKAGLTVNSNRRCRCGVTMDERTPGCVRCTKRHERRRAIGHRNVVELIKVCTGCGCPLGKTTDGCKTCTKRHWVRRVRGRPFVSAKEKARLDERRAA